MNEMLLLWAEIAMGNDYALMSEYRWRRKLGWQITPESLERIATHHAKKLIWC